MEPIIFENVAIPREALDADAVRALTRLQRRGVESYLVGGCVRDLLLGLVPKDFDIATEARPRKVKALFSNCRIIGRRFKLAHLQFGQKIIEVSTFRKTPEGPENGEPGAAEGEPDLLIREDNEFGTAEEDARRRDFTINGLFYDPERNRIIDYVGGLADLEQRAIRTIGDPWIRFREDPVRILRAVKFTSRLGFHPGQETFQAMCDVAPDLVRSATPRVLEEIFRLLRSGTALQAFEMLRDVQALPVILPEVGDFLANANEAQREVFWRHLEALDEWIHTHREVPDNALLLAPLFYPVVCQRAPAHDGTRLIQVVEDLVSGFALRMRLPRREAGRLKRICVVQRRFHQQGGGTGRRRFRPMMFVRQEYFGDALLLFYLHTRAEGQSLDLYEEWVARAERARAEGLTTIPPRRHADADDRDEGDLAELMADADLEQEPQPESAASPEAGSEPVAAEPGNAAPDETEPAWDPAPADGDDEAGFAEWDPARPAPQEGGAGDGQPRDRHDRDQDFHGDRGGRRRRRRRGRDRKRDRERAREHGGRPQPHDGGRPGQDRSHDRSGPERQGQDRPGHGQERGGFDRPRQDRPGQDRGRQDRGGQDRGRPQGRPDRQQHERQHPRQDRRDRDRPREPVAARDDSAPSIPIVDPEAIDLDPTRVPTFGSILGTPEEPGRKPQEQRRKHGGKKNQDEEPESYVPPPPPTFEPKPPVAPDDVFGDW